MLSAINRNHCPQSIGNPVRNRRNPHGYRSNSATMASSGQYFHLSFPTTPWNTRDRSSSLATDLARAGGVLLTLVVVEMDEVAAHQAARFPAVLGAGLVVEISNLLQ